MTLPKSIGTRVFVSIVLKQSRVYVDAFIKVEDLKKSVNKVLIKSLIPFSTACNSLMTFLGPTVNFVSNLLRKHRQEPGKIRQDIKFCPTGLAL